MDASSPQLVVYYTRVVPDYRVPVLEALNERLGGALMVLSGQPSPKDALNGIYSNRASGYKQYFVRNHWLYGDKVHASWPFQYLTGPQKPSALLIEEAPWSLTTPLLLASARRQKIGSVLWGHFSSNNRVFSPENVVDRYRLYLARQATCCLCYSEPIREMLLPYLPAQRLFTAPNTLDTRILFTLRTQLEQRGRAAVRAEIGLPTQAPVLVFIGRLLPNKGADMLLDVHKRLRPLINSQLVVIGDGPLKAHIEQRIVTELIPGVRLLGSMPAWHRSAPWLFASDLLVIPGPLGLSVNHAFCFGLPVVSQESPKIGTRFHGPEITYIHQHVNGILTPHGNVDAMIAAVRTILAEQRRFSEAASRTAREELGLDRMLDGLCDAIDFASTSYDA